MYRARLGMDAILELIGQHAFAEYLQDFLIDDEEMIDHWPNLCHPRVQDSIKKYLEDVVPYYRGSALPPLRGGAPRQSAVQCVALVEPVR